MVKNGNSQGRDIIEVLVIEFIQDYIKRNIRRDVAIIVNKTLHPREYYILQMSLCFFEISEGVISLS